MMSSEMRSLIAGAIGVAFVGLAAFPALAGTLDAVRQRGALRCGVSDGLPGFSERASGGEWAGFDASDSVVPLRARSSTMPGR